MARSFARREIHTFIHLDIYRAPPNVILGGFLVDNALVFGTSASLLAREVDKSTRGRDDSTFVANGIFIEERDWSVALQIDLVHIEAGLRVEIKVLPDDCEGD